MAVDIQGFDIVFSAANANHARAIDQSIARMSEKVPTLGRGLSEIAKALETLGKLNIDGVKKNLDSVKNSIESIDGSKLGKVFELATAKSEGLLNSVTSLVNTLGKVDLPLVRGGAKSEIYDGRSSVTTTRETGSEYQNQEQINALIRQREGEMQRLITLQNAMNEGTAKENENKKRLLGLYQEQLKLKGKIGSLDNQRTIVSERSQGTITALSPKQEQLAKEYAQQLAKVNAEISRTASLVGYVDAQNAKESTRIALLEQEIKLQKELDKALEKIYAEQQKKSDAANVGLSASQIKSLENEYARLLVQIDKVNAARREMNEKQGVAWSTGNTQAFAQLSSGIQAADKELIRLNERKAQLENESQLQLDKIRETHERKRGEQAVKDFEKSEREKTQIAEREAKKPAYE